MSLKRTADDFVNGGPSTPSARQTLGGKQEAWSPGTKKDSMTAAEHLIEMLENHEGPFEISQDLLYSPVHTVAHTTPAASTPRNLDDDEGYSSSLYVLLPCTDLLRVISVL